MDISQSGLRGYFSCFRWYGLQCSPLTWAASSRARDDIDAHRDLVFLAGYTLFPMIVLPQRVATSLAAIFGGGAAAGGAIGVSEVITLEDAFPVRVVAKVNSGDSRGSSCSAIGGSWCGSTPLCAVAISRIGDVSGGGGSITCVVSSSFHEIPPSRSAMSTNMRLSLCSACMVESLMSRFFLPSAEYNALADAITLSAWDTVGFMRYLCLKKTVSDTRSYRVLSTWMMCAQSPFLGLATFPVAAVQ